MSVCIYIGFTKSSQDGIGTAASVVTLIGPTVTLIQQVRTARDRVKGTSKTLDSLSKQLDSLHRSFSLVRDEKALQTAGAGHGGCRRRAEILLGCTGGRITETAYLAADPLAEVRG